MVFSWVEKELFLEDMISGRSDFCSPFLVNAILAQACHFSPRVEFAGEPWNERYLGNKFFIEAKRLWDCEEGAIKLTNVQACLILNACLNADGKDRIGTLFSSIAVHMARDLGLFKEQTPPPPGDSRAEKMYRARIFAGWGVFSFAS